MAWNAFERVQLGGLNSIHCNTLPEFKNNESFVGELQNRHASHNIQINVMEWKLAPELMSWEAIWDYGALALLTDCVYSNMPSSTYTYIGLTILLHCFGFNLNYFS